MSKKSGQCRTEGCQRPQLEGTGGLCHLCNQRFLERKNVEQNTEIIKLLSNLNDNISQLSDKLSNVETMTKQQSETSDQNFKKIEKTVDKLNEVFIPEISTDYDAKSDTKETKQSGRNVQDLASKLKDLDIKKI